MFIPGETIAHRFKIPFLREGITKILVTYKQNNSTILVKTVHFANIQENIPGNNCYFTVTLSQEESLLFKNNTDFKVQINVVFSSGVRTASIELDGANGIQHMRKVVNTDGQ